MSSPQPQCGWVDADRTVCEKPAKQDDHVFVNNRWVNGLIYLCPTHKATYNKKAAASRVSQREKNTPTTTR